MHTRLCRLFLINQKGNCWKSFFMATHNLVSFNECLLNKKNLIVFFPLSVLFFHMSVTIVLSCVMSHAGARCRPETKAYSSHCYKPSSTTLLTLDRHAKSLRLTTAEPISLAFYTTQKIVFYQLSKLSIYLSICLYLSIHPSIHASIHIYLSLSLSVCLSICLSVCIMSVEFLMKPRPRLCLGRTAAYLLPGKTRRICSIKPLRDEIRTVRSSHRPAYIIREALRSPARFRLEMPSHWVSMQTRVRAGLDLCNRDGLTKFGTCCLHSRTKRTIQKNTRKLNAFKTKSPLALFASCACFSIKVSLCGMVEFLR